MNKKYLCIIPARAGSKAIRNKNFIKVNNKFLVQYSIDTAIKLKKYCDIIVSSDSKKIIKILKNNKLQFTGLRPKNLSKDSSSTYDVVKYELFKKEKEIKQKYKGILLLQPTCPIRDTNKIIRAFKILKSRNYDSLVSVTNVNANNPARMKKFRNKYLINYLNTKKENMKPRQDLPEVYIRSGSIYLIKRESLLRYRSLVGKKCYGMILEGVESINLDTQDDLILLKHKLKNETHLS